VSGGDETVRRIGENWGMVPASVRGVTRHCGGCKGFGAGWEGDCAGVSPDQFRLTDFRYAIPPRLPWKMRLRILFGASVATAPESAVVESRTIPDAQPIVWRSREDPPS
jgi:hypothetical protein